MEELLSERRDGYAEALAEIKAVWHSGFKTEDEAKAFRDERRVSLRKGHAVRKNRITVEQYLAQWLPLHSQTKPLSPNTVYRYERQWRRRLSTPR